MAFYDLTIKLIDGKRFRKQSSTDFKNDCYIHDECPDSTIPSSSVANMLAKLSGQRPYKRADLALGKTPKHFEIFKEMALRAYIAIATPPRDKEIIRSAKSTHSPTKDSWTLTLDDKNYNMIRNKPTYTSVKAVLDASEWDALNDILSQVYGVDYRSNTKSGASSFVTAIQSLRDSFVGGNKLVVSFCEKFKDTTSKLRDLIIIPVTTGVPVVDGNGYKVFRIDGTIGKTPMEKVLHTKTNTHGILTAQVVSGTIHVKVTEDEIEMFRNGPGFATFLDGGIAELESLDLNYWNPDIESLPTPFKIA